MAFLQTTVGGCDNLALQCNGPAKKIIAINYIQSFRERLLPEEWRKTFCHQGTKKHKETMDSEDAALKRH